MLQNTLKLCDFQPWRSRPPEPPTHSPNKRAQQAAIAPYWRVWHSMMGFPEEAIVPATAIRTPPPTCKPETPND
ncbi:hypothetical protein [Oxynema aestuarii]|uniref:Uncharacterized protein n=1 Tax=Oxynema aestuarii AP17 TaxID=2064643 RepID=A0A6H1TV66_9CYAN|nr:hypothetical protein [Oxynema aestuarii]QIZ69219.1 hypothetical protein HCG48_00295 [Oxynema aestuarii AP17]